MKYMLSFGLISVCIGFLIFYDPVSSPMIFTRSSMEIRFATTTMEIKDKKMYLTDYEMERLFPDKDKDWAFVTEMVGVSQNIEMPEFEYHQYNVFNDFMSAASYSSIDYTISINRQHVFTSTTTGYIRYIFLHEVTHALLDKSGQNRNHCHMAEYNMFIKMGQRIGNKEYGEKEQKEYEGICLYYE